MNIIFGNWREEIVCDDHGHPCRTDYSVVFMIGRVKFTADFNDFSRSVDVYQNYRHVMTIYSDDRMNTEKAEQLIKADSQRILDEYRGQP